VTENPHGAEDFGPGGGGPGRTGLRRFVKRPPAAAAPGTRGPAARAPGVPTALAGLRRPTDGAAPDAERCEMCHAVLDDRHGHLVEVDKRSIACACRACYLLFTHEGAAGGRYRAVPERICYDPGRPLSAADWNELQIPVTMAFFFFNSVLGRIVAGYPSPGGVTECELDLAAWDRLAAAYPLFGEMAADTEAIFVKKDEVFLIPIDMCYSLVGEFRLHWQGFDGGAEVREALDTFLTGLRRRAIALERQPLEMEES
jgi:Family of unknown function (DUF5947)